VGSTKSSQASELGYNLLGWRGYTTSPQKLRLVHVKVSWHPAFDISDAMLQSTDSWRDIVTMTMQVLCVVGKRMEIYAVLVGRQCTRWTTVDQELSLVELSTAHERQLTTGRHPWFEMFCQTNIRIGTTEKTTPLKLKWHLSQSSSSSWLTRVDCHQQVILNLHHCHLCAVASTEVYCVTGIKSSRYCLEIPGIGSNFFLQ